MRSVVERIGGYRSILGRFVSLSSHRKALHMASPQVKACWYSGDTEQTLEQLDKDIHWLNKKHGSLRGPFFQSRLMRMHSQRFSFIWVLAADFTSCIWRPYSKNCDSRKITPTDSSERNAEKLLTKISLTEPQLREPLNCKRHAQCLLLFC